MVAVLLQTQTVVLQSVFSATSWSVLAVFCVVALIVALRPAQRPRQAVLMAAVIAVLLASAATQAVAFGPCEWKDFWWAWWC
jgi:hypothetical protein